MEKDLYLAKDDEHDSIETKTFTDIEGNKRMALELSSISGPLGKLRIKQVNYN